MSRNSLFRIVFFIMLLLVHACSRSSLAPLAPPPQVRPEEETAPISDLVACSPDTPTIVSGETVGVKAWVSSLTGQPLQYSWSATTGDIEGLGTEAHWNFSDVQPGAYETTVRVSNSKGESINCSVRVIVRPRLRGENRETGKSFLLPDQAEAKGYGLYSYLLLGAPPSDDVRNRYLKSVEAFLKFPNIAEIEKHVDRHALNITYLPIKVPLAQAMLDQLGEGNYTHVAEWVLKHYDYARARAILGGLSGEHQNGPYFVSSLKLYDRKAGLSRPYLYQDQSGVPPNLVSLWVREFLNQAAQERFWEERTGERLALKLRTTIGILAIGLPEVRTALEGWITWVS